MSDIGETLREARIRRRIDMAEVEEATKIRAKYLRALENEEWDLLPGPTYVKTFLRSYADYLELDSRRLVEEYKLRYERPRAGEAAPFGGLASGRGQPRRGRRGRPPAALGPVVVLAAIVVVLLAALYALGSWGRNDANSGRPPTTSGQSATQPATATSGGQPQRARTATKVHLRLVATGDVYVCLVDGAGRRLIDGRTFSAGQRSARFTARRLRVTFGTDAARMRVGGKTYRVATNSHPVGYELRPGRKPRRLSAAQRPVCA